MGVLTALCVAVPTDPDALTLILGVAYRAISAHLLAKAGLTRATGSAGAVTLVQRFGSALTLNIHFHMILPDCVYVPVDGAAPVFRHVPGPTRAELQLLVEQIAGRTGKLLERRGIVERNIENAWLSADGEPSALDDLNSHSITYGIAVCPRAGQKLFTLQTLPAMELGIDQQGAIGMQNRDAAIRLRVQFGDLDVAQVAAREHGIVVVQPPAAAVLHDGMMWSSPLWASRNARRTRNGP